MNAAFSRRFFIAFSLAARFSALKNVRKKIEKIFKKSARFS